MLVTTFVVAQLWERGLDTIGWRATLALDAKVILTPPCIFH
jgi:hypothetical protein